jgi:L-asparaginase
MSLVVVLSTGGTISSRPGRDAAVVSTDGAAELVGRIAAAEGIDVQALDVLKIGSYQLDLANLRTVHDAVVEQLDRPEVDGVVITHGTDTLEETAALLDLVHDDSRPVVLTGAQRSADAADGDGPRNLRDAITVAASPVARETGVLVVFAGSIFAARGTRKMHTTDVSPFRTLDGGPLGTVAGDVVRLTVRPERTKPLPHPVESFDDVRVDLVALYPGADATLLDASVAAGARGVVLAASGIGNANSAVVEAVANHTASGVVVAVSSRVPEGPVVPVYGDGGGVDLVRAGAVVARELPSFQTRVLLALLLSLDLTGSDVRRALETYA